MKPPKIRFLPALLAALLAAMLVVLAACGDDDTTESSTDDGGAETPDADADDSDAATDDAGDDAAGDALSGEAAGSPTAIVSLSPSITEMLFAVGAGDAVVAVDDQSNYPEDAPTTDLSGFTPNIEAIAGYEPDLVIFSGDPGGLADGLDALAIETLDLPAPATIDDLYAQIDEIGEVAGHAEEAEALVGEMQNDIDTAVADAPSGDGLSYFHELDNTLFSVTSATFIGEVYGLFGLENVADAADADGALGGYPQLSEEFLVDADPDLIFIADTKCCGETAETVAARPGWDQLSAVQNDAIVELDDDVASRWGPRVVEFVEAIAAALQTAAVPA